mmetsp:Transcript_23449/g.56130  ORF Transcript_23449/g.56130 Transcript_23449/m.56130 type:complete len:259 (+) Transcript_23449:342-1118(+)
MISSRLFSASADIATLSNTLPKGGWSGALRTRDSAALPLWPLSISSTVIKAVATWAARRWLISCCALLEGPVPAAGRVRFAGYRNRGAVGRPLEQPASSAVSSTGRVDWLDGPRGSGSSEGDVAEHDVAEIVGDGERATEGPASGSVGGVSPWLRMASGSVGGVSQEPGGGSGRRSALGGPSWPRGVLPMGPAQVSSPLAPSSAPALRRMGLDILSRDGRLSGETSGRRLRPRRTRVGDRAGLNLGAVARVCLSFRGL